MTTAWRADQDAKLTAVLNALGALGHGSMVPYELMDEFNALAEKAAQMNKQMWLRRQCDAKCRSGEAYDA